MTNELMSTREVAGYLRVKERKIYDLVAKGEIPCTRIAGKWLFPRSLVDAWLLDHAQGPAVAQPKPDPPAIVAGSHDPLLEWAVRESGSELAVLFDGSLDGLERFARRQARACGMHVIEGTPQAYNVATVARRLPGESVVLVEWARREQGLLVAPGNPLAIRGVEDLPGRRFVFRQREAGSHVLLDHLLGEQGLARDDLMDCGTRARNETEVALTVARGEAEVGLAVAGVALPLRLDFVPLARERYDLLVWRRSYFEPDLQALLAFARTPAFRRRAESLGGYGLGDHGRVHYNGP